MTEASRIAAAFETVGGFTVGVEEEVMLLDPETLELSARADQVLSRLEGDRDPSFKPELPAAHLEIVTEPQPSAADAVARLAAGRRRLAEAASGIGRVAAAGVHPFSAPSGELSTGTRYDSIRGEYGWVAHRQLVGSLQIHVAVGGAERTLAVYNGLRCWLPELAALAANAPLYQGTDTGLASVRPLICTALPRQGVPPRIAGWAQFAEELRWGRVSGALSDPGRWWWELRPHLVHGTLELRVPDAQTTLGEAAGIVGFAQALMATLADWHDAGEPLPDAPTWRIEENRWSALRHGLDGSLASLESGARQATRERLTELIETVEPAAERLGAASLLERARGLVEVNGAMRQREVFGELGGRGLAEWLAGRFLSDV